MAAGNSADNISDAELIELCNSGSRTEAHWAFDALYKRHKDFVLRVALRFAPDPDTALDALQETFTYLLRKFPPPGNGLQLSSQLATLLYPAAKNNALTLRRKAERFPTSTTVDPDDIQADTPTADSDIVAVLEALPAQRREVLTMRFVDDLSLQEIADALEIPLGTVKSRLHLGIRQLKESPAAKKLLKP